MYPTHMNMESSSLIEKGMVNFIEHGSLYVKIPEINSGLAIDEICPTIRSHLNF